MRNGKKGINMELIRLDNVRSVLEEYAQGVVDQYKQNHIDNGRPASGKLLDSVRYEIVQNGQAWEVQLSLQDYWKYIEYGTKPHFPPVNKILEWIKIKPVIPRPFDNGKIPTQEQLAFLISRKISEVGTQGSEDLEEALLDVNYKFKDKLVYALHQDFEVLMNVIVGDFKGHVPGGLY